VAALRSIGPAIGAALAFSFLEPHLSAATAPLAAGPEMFDRLFGGFTPDTGTTPPPYNSGDQIRADRRSVLDFVKGNYDRLMPILGSDDRIKLEGHLDALRSIERRLDGSVTPTTPGGLSPACDPSQADPAGGNFTGNDQIPDAYDIMMDMMVMALACDRTRIASFQPMTSITQARFSWVGVNDAFHFGAMHGNAAKEPSRRAINGWFVSKLPRLIDLLKSVPEGDGTLFDHTIVVWAGEMANGYHGAPRAPYIITGGGANYFRLGQHVKHKETQYNNRVLHSLLDAYNMDQPIFGDYDEDLDPANRGPLTGVT